MGFWPSVLCESHPPLPGSDVLRSAGAKGLIAGFGFFPALPNGHVIKREDSKGSLNSEGATSSPDQSENVTYLGLEGPVLTAPVCGLG